MMAVQVGRRPPEQRPEALALLSQRHHRDVALARARTTPANNVAGQLQVEADLDPGLEQRHGVDPLARHHHADGVNRAGAGGRQDAAVISPAVTVVVGGDDQGRPLSHDQTIAAALGMASAAFA